MASAWSCGDEVEFPRGMLEGLAAAGDPLGGVELLFETFVFGLSGFEGHRQGLSLAPSDSRRP
eukprot:1624929-Heterocapsa_arctica.AAC.1